MTPLGPFDLAALAVIVLGILVTLRRDVPKAYGLGMTCLAVFAIDQIGQTTGHAPLAEALGFRWDQVRHGDRPWSVVSSMFVHSGWGHIFGNLFILVTAGPALEDRIGGRKFLLIYYLAGLGATTAHVVLALTTSIVPAYALAIGASGAIFGVLTTFAVRYPRERLPLILFFFVAWLPAFFVLLIYLGFNIVYMLGSGGNIAWWGHFAGFLVGLPFAYTLPKTAAEDVPRQGTTRGLPDPEKLAPLATTRDLQRILERIRQFTPDARTAHDAHFADAWVDKFFEKATCANGHAFRRAGLAARCDGGETTVEFGR